MIRDPEIHEESDDAPMSWEDDDPQSPVEDDEPPPDDDEPSAEIVEQRRAAAEALAQRRAAAQPDDGPDVEDDINDDDLADVESTISAMKSSESTMEEDATPPTGTPLSERWVPYRDLVTEYKHWTNPRTVTGLDDASLSALAASIKAETSSNETGTFAGLHDRMKVVQIEVNGGVVNLVIDGQRRHRAIDLAGLGEDVLVPVTDLEPDPVKWTRELAAKYLFSAIEGVGTRAGLSTFELGENAERLRGEKDPDTGAEYTLAKIARAIGRSESWVSKMLTARKHATPKLLHQWKLGEITDEQFKDLARAKDEEQEEKAKEVAEARKSEGRVAARALSRETLMKARAESAKAKPEKAAKARAKAEPEPAPVVRGPQQEIPVVAPPKRNPPSFAVVEDTLSLADKRPPTHDYVKGIMDGARWAVGLMSPADFGKAWRTYTSRVANAPKSPAKKGKKK